MHLLLAPDSFKGSLTAGQAAEAMATGARRVCADARVTLMPMADGGEGTLDIVLSLMGGERHVWNALPAGADYGMVEIGGERVMVIETARLVGLMLPEMRSRSVLQRHTECVGQLIRHGLDAGCRQFLIGLGGSATNDGGAGLLFALGARFLDAAGQALPPAPAALRRLHRIDFSGLDTRVLTAAITLMTDVANPLSGANGATRVYGPQKGVLPQQVDWLDDALARLGKAGDAWAGQTVSGYFGSGAAGGLGFALQLMGARVQSGAELLLDMYRFEDRLTAVDWVVTGEGRSDAQTLAGKAPWVVARRAHACGVPVALISGSLDDKAQQDFGHLFDACLALRPPGMSARQAMAQAAVLLADRTSQWLRQQLQCRA